MPLLKVSQPMSPLLLQPTAAEVLVPPVDPMKLQTNANGAADNMLHLKRSTDLKRQGVTWELGVLLQQSDIDEGTSVAEAKVIHSWEVLDTRLLQVNPRG